MNKLGIHALVWAGGWSHEECTQAIEQTAEIGYDYIEIPALDPSSIDVDFTRQRLEKANLGVSLSLGLAPEADISSEDPEKIARGEATLRDAVLLARDVGSPYVCGILYSAFTKYFHPPTRKGVENSIEVLRRVSEQAKKSDITIGLEVVNRYESNVINTAAQAVEVCKRVGTPNIKVHLDTYHMNIEENDVVSAMKETGDFLNYFHIGESHRGYLGSGSINFDDVFRGIVYSGYKGPITFESFSNVVVHKELASILGIWRNLWDDGFDLAVHAKAFMDTHLKSAHESISASA
ncbi:MAG: sugar phosphate isomerase/epimerase [SAR324 cluster bacterium]|nr:sugar phosphate isomerase/epimerase [SAR324 cluster bacterium]